MKLKKKMYIIIVAIVLLVIALVYSQYLSPVSFSADTVNFTDEGVFESVKYTYSEGFKKDNPNDETRYLNEKKDLPSNNPKDYIKVFYSIKANNKSIFDISRVDMLIYEIYKYKDRFLYSYSSSDVINNAVNRLGKSTITCGYYVYIGGLSEDEKKELMKSVSVKLVYQTEFFGTRTKTINMNNIQNFVNSPYMGQ